ncbi:hypothetical protein [Micromonospora sp. DT233]|uniref:hypothetical protein n=1 Tax=Micromonospora sp. DT233 TaxID=3393432 RepID=UPI003CEA1E0B
MKDTDKPSARSRQAEDAERAQEAEREAARRRLLAQAEADRLPLDDTTRALPDRRWRRDQP